MKTVCLAPSLCRDPSCLDLKVGLEQSLCQGLMVDPLLDLVIFKLNHLSIHL